MRPNLDLVFSFVVVANELSFARAAERLRLDPSRISRHIRTLEQALGCELLSRTTRQVVLTRQGRALLPEARAMVEAADRVERTMQFLRDGQERDVRIGVLRSASGAKRSALFELFAKRFSRSKLVVDYGSTNFLLDKLRQNTLDVTLANEPFEPDGFVSDLFEEQPLLLVAPKEDCISGSGPVTIESLESRKVYVVPRHLSAELHRRIYDGLSAVGATVVGFPDTDASASLYFAQANRICMLTYVFPDSFHPAADMVVRPLNGAGLSRRSYLVRLTGREDPVLDWIFATAAKLGADGLTLA
jgi:DNA-binding transcriptional LysR family regulator